MITCFTNLFLCWSLFSSRVCELLRWDEGDQPWLLRRVRYPFHPRAEEPRQLKERGTVGKNNRIRGNVDAEENPYIVEFPRTHLHCITCTFIIETLILCTGTIIMFHISHWNWACLPVTEKWLNIFCQCVDTRKSLIFLKASILLHLLWEVNLLIDLLTPPASCQRPSPGKE